MAEVPSHDEELTPGEAFDKLLSTLVGLHSFNTSAPRPWSRGMPGYMRPGRAMWFGPRGCGKTDAALTAAVDVVAAGGRAMYIDMENGAPRMAERLDCILKCRPDDVREGAQEDLLYFDRFNFSLLDDPVVLGEMQSWVKDVDLLVLDSLPRIFGQLGLNENEPSHVVHFAATYVDPLISKEATAIIALDNVGHTATSRPRGASAKEDLFELGYLVSGGQTCSKAKHGEIILTRKRHRDGDEHVNMTLGFGGGEYGSIGPDDTGSKLLDATLSVLTEPQSKNWLFGKMKEAKVGVGRAKYFKLVDAWVEDPDSGIIQTLDGRYAPAED
jgi:hypothetical protein